VESWLDDLSTISFTKFISGLLIIDWLIDWLIDSHIDSDSTYIDVWLANKQSYMCVQATIVRTQENFARLFVAESFGYVVA